MQTIFLLVGIIGLVMFYFGIKTLLKIYFSKVIVDLNFSVNPKEIEIDKSGSYAICFVGGHVTNKDNFDISITYNGNELDVYEKKLKSRFKHNGQITTEFYQFEAEDIGKYMVEFKNIDDLEIKKSMLLSKRILENQNLNNEKEIVIRETVKFSKFIIALLMSVFGFNIAGWGIILAMNPNFWFSF